VAGDADRHRHHIEAARLRAVTQDRRARALERGPHVVASGDRHRDHHERERDAAIDAGDDATAERVSAA